MMLIICWYLSCHDLEEMLQMFYRHFRKCRIILSSFTVAIDS